jgi:hypothetical protein
MDEFMSKRSVDPDQVLGLEQNIQTAIDFKYLSAPLTAAQLAELMQVQSPAK